MFDSNVWQIVTNPDDFINDPSLLSFRKIHQAIVDKKIEPFLSETIFTIEAINKIERQEFFSSPKAKIYNEKEYNEDGKIHLKFIICSSEKDAIEFNGRPILKKYFYKATELGFKIVRFPRIGGIINKEVDTFIFKQEGEDLQKYLDKVFEVGNKIEDIGAGIIQIKEIGNQFVATNWFEGIKKTPQSYRKKIAKAIAEWADGDSVAISISLGCDYFCTRDKAKGAGSKSILSKQNLIWLNKEYGFKTINPEELAKLI